MGTPRYTILCATYNQAPYLEEMLDSALAQTLEDAEVVVVDDGSTDETPEVLARLLARLPDEQRARVVVDRTSNRGQTAAYERGLALSSGEYVCLLDSDDRFAPDKLARLEEATRAHPEAGMLMHPLRVIDPDGRQTGVVRPRAAELSHGDVREQMLRTARHVAPGASGLVFRRDLLARLFPAPVTRFTFAADAYLSFGAAALAPVVALPEPLADYRMHPNGQYLLRMLSPEGLRRQLEFQDSVAGHFGLTAAALHNSHWARNRFASAMYDGPWSRRLVEARRLLAATARDAHFTPLQKLVLLGFWTGTLLAGPRAFPRVWRWFQLRQTGWHRVAAAGRGAHPEPRDRASRRREASADRVTPVPVAIGTDGGSPDRCETAQAATSSDDRK